MYTPDSNTQRNAQNLAVDGPINNTPAGKPIAAMNFYPAEVLADGAGARVYEAPSRTRLKMRVNGKSVGTSLDNPLTHLSLAAVQSTDSACENHVFGKYTPSGNLSFSVINEVADKFELGDEVYLDLSLASRQ